ncbi:hypothetical protein, partial [Enterococcus faecium]|uniref:hypothetical protein n=1 Tax=Enterococcus faecium TaxID=1352 RepID=UPI00211A06D0
MYLNRKKKFKKNIDASSLLFQPPVIPVSYTHLDVYKRQFLNNMERLKDEKIRNELGKNAF